ncbi:hypothetical protein EDD85DRAFT_13820 [Armillaria nabsnona]|nr:hypothetical protein EDD85DRAFT_13820 [Armillaria nabsnona]
MASLWMICLARQGTGGAAETCTFFRATEVIQYPALDAHQSKRISVTPGSELFIQCNTAVDPGARLCIAVTAEHQNVPNESLDTEPWHELDQEVYAGRRRASSRHGESTANRKASCK